MADFPPVDLPVQGEASGAAGAWDDLLNAAIRQLEQNLNVVKALAESIAGESGDLDEATAALVLDEASATYAQIVGLIAAIVTDAPPNIVIDSITNAGATGKASLAAADKAAGRAAIDAQVDTWRPTADDISDATTEGKTLLKIANLAALQSRLGITTLLNSERAIQVFVWNTTAGAYTPAVPSTPTPGTVLRLFVGPDEYFGPTWTGVVDINLYNPGVA